MKDMINRPDDVLRLQTLIDQFPVTVMLGPRQCGKTTISRMLKADHYFDLENPRDLARLKNPQITLENLKGLIVIDEIQRMPELFPLLRYLVDNKPGAHYLLLGSASRDLIKQSSESLAGRAAYYELSGITLSNMPEDSLHNVWFRGGFPPALLSENEESCMLWLEHYIQNYLERDIPQLGIRIPAATLRRFWTMLSHYHGQVLNFSEISRSFGISDKTVRHYIEILEGTFMIRLIQPWHINIRKRLVKAPKLYIRDSGIFHYLQMIGNPTSLYSHNKLGASWEGFVIEEVIRCLRISYPYFWRTHQDAELDLLWFEGGNTWGIEIKYSDAPRLTRSIHHCLNDLKPEHLWIIYPGKDTYSLSENVTVLPLTELEQLHS